MGWVELKLCLNEKKKYIVIIDRRKYLKYFMVERVVLSLFKLRFVGVVWCYNLWFNEFYVILKIYYFVKFYLVKKEW